MGGVKELSGAPGQSHLQIPGRWESISKQQMWGLHIALSFSDSNMLRTEIRHYLAPNAAATLFIHCFFCLCGEWVSGVTTLTQIPGLERNFSSFSVKHLYLTSECGPYSLAAQGNFLQSLIEISGKVWQRPRPMEILPKIKLAVLVEVNTQSYSSCQRTLSLHLTRISIASRKILNALQG